MLKLASTLDIWSRVRSRTRHLELRRNRRFIAQIGADLRKLCACVEISQKEGQSNGLMLIESALSPIGTIKIDTIPAR